MKEKQKAVRISLPVVHFLLTFLWERRIIEFNSDIHVVKAIALSNFLSDKAERIIGYSVAKIFCIIGIITIWHIFFWVLDNYKKETYVKTFIWLFLLGMIVLIFLWPDAFIHSEDNLITYSYAVRLFPEYWHSAYSSIIFCASLMIIPSPLSIMIMQWLLAVCSMGYLTFRIVNSPKLGGKCKYISLVLLAFPGSFLIFFDAYRTEQYALLTFLYVSIIVMDILDKKQRSMLSLFSITWLGAFISVWRSEGIIIGLLGFISLLFCCYFNNKIKAFIFIATFCICLTITNFPQKLGMDKYYGSDYSIVNSFPSLQNIFNSYDSNLSYDGVEEDLESINNVVGVGYICMFGLDGYRRSNYVQGRLDFNQSGASKVDAEAYVKAYYNIILHNIPIYAKTQISMFTNALGITPYVYSVPMKEEWGAYLPMWEYDAWNIGKSDLLKSEIGRKWQENPVRQIVAERLLTTYSVLNLFMLKTYLTCAIYIFIIFSHLYIFLYELIALIRKEKKEPFIACLSFALLGQFAAIILVMPAAMISYFHATVLAMLVTECVYYINRKQMKKVN